MRWILALCWGIVADPVSASGQAGAPCGPDRIDEYVAVDRVHDGDTLRLRDGRKLRLLGINTPELARDQRPPEAHAEAARAALQAFLRGTPRVGLRYDEVRHDAYGRLLAHVYLEDGEDAAAHLLALGWGYALTIPPNLWNSDCYAGIERSARRAARGLWASETLLGVETLTPSVTGYRRVSGRLLALRRSAESVWLDFGTPFSARIPKADLEYFAGIDMDAWRRHELVMRGWIHSYRGKPVMTLRHPLSIEVED